MLPPDLDDEGSTAYRVNINHHHRLLTIVKTHQLLSNHIPCPQPPFLYGSYTKDSSLYYTQTTYLATTLYNSPPLQGLPHDVSEIICTSQTFPETLISPLLADPKGRFGGWNDVIDCEWRRVLC